jgi:hypothetical protein
LNSGNVPSAAQSNFRGAVGTNTSNTFDAARRATGARHVGPPGYYQRVKELEERRKRGGPVRAGAGDDTESRTATKQEVYERLRQQQRKQQIIGQDPEYVEQLRAMEEGRGAFDTTEETEGGAAAAAAASGASDDQSVDKIETLAAYVQQPGRSNIPQEQLQTMFNTEIEKTKSAGYDPTIQRQSLLKLLDSNEKRRFGSEKQTPTYKIYKYLTENKGYTPKKIAEESKKYDNPVSIGTNISKFRKES